MRKTLLVTTFVVIALLLAACEPGDPFAGAPRPAPTQAAAPAPARAAPDQPAQPTQPDRPVPGQPQHAVRLTQSQVTIPNWGYGPWGIPGLDYQSVKLKPGATVPTGHFQLETDFNGSNWRNNGEWSYTLPAGVSEVWVTTQGDAPLEVSWQGSTLTMRTNDAITARAPAPPDNTPRKTGSTGTSLVGFIR